ncbi:MAG TPA: PepSY-associated TM helix domain-containing protein [Flavihumibacter sp.]|nr:PepSY domain-containing protein [Bacteroidota bacterium]HQD09718.1 PepSY-associated TM helix domain-containing protein [Flavihumibacter sp.]
MRFKKIVGKIHLWLGLASGAIVLFLGITGCVLAFQTEIESLQSFRHVKPESRAFLPPSKMLALATAALPNKKAHGVSYGDRDKPAQVSYYDLDYYYVAYFNPYSGELLKLKNMDRDFFRVVVNGHFYLWLPPAIGQPIVASATLVFFVMLISGIILWWPRNKAAAKQRFSIKWSASFKRKNYDLHNVLGFYASWIAMVFAITGLVWGFQWFGNGLYFISSGGKQMVPFEEGLSDKSKAALASVPAIDQLWERFKTEAGPGKTVEVHFPSSDSTAVEVALNPSAGTYWKTDYRYFDQYTMQELDVKHPFGKFANASAADKIVRMNYDVHTGQILGLPGKILAFCGSLIAASLPVTGFLIWRGRRRKKPAAAKLNQPLRGIEVARG